jgi:hypothetical protein
MENDLLTGGCCGVWCPGFLVNGRKKAADRGGLSDRCAARDALVGEFFYDNGGAVGQDLGDSVHDFVGVVAEGDDGVGAELGGVEAHHCEGVLAGLFAEFGEEGDVAADDGLNFGAEGGDDVSRADDDAADYAEIADDAVVGNFEGGGDECGIEDGLRWGVGRHGGFAPVAGGLRAGLAGRLIARFDRYGLDNSTE